MDANKENFNVIDLIEFVEERPILWDKQNNEYKDRIKKDKAWSEISSFLIPSYDGMDQKNKQNTGESKIHNVTNLYWCGNVFQSLVSEISGGE